MSLMLVTMGFTAFWPSCPENSKIALLQTINKWERVSTIEIYFHCGKKPELGNLREIVVDTVKCLSQKNAVPFAGGFLHFTDVGKSVNHKFFSARTDDFLPGQYHARWKKIGWVKFLSRAAAENFRDKSEPKNENHRAHKIGSVNWIQSFSPIAFSVSNIYRRFLS
jgi:hypothetical protein